jgi:hypothetical protein
VLPEHITFFLLPLIISRLASDDVHWKRLCKHKWKQELKDVEKPVARSWKCLFQAKSVCALQQSSYTNYMVVGIGVALG